MAAFPKLRTGAVAQYPSTRTVQAPVTVLRFVDGSEQRFRNTRALVKRWEIRLSDVSEAELASVETFFSDHHGQARSFEFTDPWDGTVYEKCSFDADNMRSVLTGEDRTTAVITIRTNPS